MMLKNAANTKDKTVKECIFSILTPIVQKYKQSLAVATCLISLLCNHEHASKSIAELMEQFVEKHANSQFVGDIIREIGKLDSDQVGNDSAAIKNVASFIVYVSQQVPKLVLQNISVIVPHLDGESYMMRNAVVQAIGFIVSNALSPNQGENNAETQDLGDNAESSSSTRDSLLDILEERFKDVNAFTRSKTIQTWDHLCKLKLVPINRLMVVTELTVGRLQDKTAHVRKNAIQFLKTILLYNPFSGNLNLKAFTSKLEECEQRLAKRHGEIVPQSQMEEGTHREEKEKMKAVEQATKDLKLRTYLKVSISFIELIHSAFSTLVQLLGSKNATDTLETIDFFQVAFSFNIEEARVGLEKAIMLLSRDNKTIKEAIVDAYNKTYLRVPPQIESNKKQGAMFVANNLIQLTKNASLGFLTSMELLVKELMNEKFVSKNVIKALWEIFEAGATLKEPLVVSIRENVESNCKGALMVLSMLGEMDPSIIKSNLKKLIDVGMNTERWKRDADFARCVCIALQKLGKTPKRMVEEEEKKKEKQDKRKSFVIGINNGFFYGLVVS